jgi:predicted unusual protein kinase regulating ubiquinone biosynthesis (AarF/ABC1/UbiB family)
LPERTATIDRPAAPPRNLGPPSGSAAFALRRTGVPQALRLAGCALGVVADAAWAGLGGRLAGRPPEARRADFAARASARCVRTLGALRGVYAKLGQFASLRLDLLPPEATTALAALRDRVPPLPYATIRRCVEGELGAPLERHFSAFSREPLGAASIAQVHRARLEDGTEVAVKVQYPWLEAALPADLALVRGLLALATRALRRGREDRERLFAEFASGLEDELDFTKEAQAARAIASNLASDPGVVVPEVFAQYSTRRVLTMRYHAAVPIDDHAGLARLGVAPRDVLVILARAYASQVFVDGHFHADPHPGNLFVLETPDADAAPQLLFVDFGLSRELDPALRDEMRQAIYALIQRDLDGFVAGMERLRMFDAAGKPAVKRAVGAMFQRIAGGGGALGLGGSQVLSLKDEAKALLQETPGLQLPADLLLYAKTLSYVFALGEALDPEVDMMKLSLPHLLRFLAQEGPAPGVGATASTSPTAGPAAE